MMIGTDTRLPAGATCAQPRPRQAHSRVGDPLHQATRAALSMPWVCMCVPQDSVVVLAVSWGDSQEEVGLCDVAASAALPAAREGPVRRHAGALPTVGTALYTRMKPFQCMSSGRTSPALE